MNSGFLPQVGLRTAKTYEDLNSGFSFRVVGDGRVENALTDQFHSAQSLETVEDRRLREFVKRENAIAFAKPAPSESEAKEQLLQAAKETLGTEWGMDALYSYGSPVSRVVFKHADGPLSQTVDIENRENPSKLTLDTNATMGGWQVRHGIDVAVGAEGVDPNTAVESAYFQR